MKGGQQSGDDGNQEQNYDSSKPLSGFNFSFSERRLANNLAATMRGEGNCVIDCKMVHLLLFGQSNEIYAQTDRQHTHNFEDWVSEVPVSRSKAPVDEKKEVPENTKMRRARSHFFLKMRTLSKRVAGSVPARNIW